MVIDAFAMPSAVAMRFMAAGAPRSPDIHLLESEAGHHLFVVNGSRLFDAEPDLFAGLGAAIAADRVSEVLSSIGVGEPPLIDNAPLLAPPIHALSLAIAQKCNLGCTYCYAQQGEFGRTAKNMELGEALRAVNLLVGTAQPGARLNLAFLGGEPLVNRKVLRAATQHAVELAKDREAKITFSITTNGTLLREDDGRFFEEHGFAVTISIDGPREVHDALRPSRAAAAVMTL